jgi:hypothetical protein
MVAFLSPFSQVSYTSMVLHCVVFGVSLGSFLGMVCNQPMCEAVASCDLGGHGE